MTKKILCAIDGTAQSSHAAEVAADLSVRLKAPLTLFIVNVVLAGMRGPAITQWTEDEVVKFLDDAVAVAKEHGAKDVERLDVVGREAASSIVTIAEEKGFDHIVVGTGDKSGFSRLMIGSVAADVARRAPCTVTIVR